MLSYLNDWGKINSLCEKNRSFEISPEKEIDEEYGNAFELDWKAPRVHSVVKLVSSTDNMSH